MKKNLLNGKWFFLIPFFLLANNTYAGSPSGKDMYSESCQGCHASNGRGSMGWVPDLTEEKAWMTMDEDELVQELKLGVRKSGEKMRMPARGGNSELSDENLRNIIRYMRTTFH